MVVYIIRNKVNGKVYIGKSENETVKRRWQLHISLARRGRGQALHKAMRKHGVENFSCRIVYSGIRSKVRLNTLERKVIKHFKSFSSKGYNMSAGGDGGLMNHNCLGYKHSLKARRNMRESHLGVKFSLTHRRNIAKGLRGKKRSAASCRKLSRRMRGNQYWLGRSHSLATRKKMRKPKTRLHRQHIRESWVLRRLQCER